MLHKIFTYPGYGIFGSLPLNIVYVAVIVFTIAQIWIAKKKTWWQGLVFPILYYLAAIPYVWKHFLTIGGPVVGRDYHSAVTFLFPGIWFLMIYYIFYYYNQCKNK